MIWKVHEIKKLKAFSSGLLMVELFLVQPFSISAKWRKQRIGIRNKNSKECKAKEKKKELVFNLKQFLDSNKTAKIGFIKHLSW